MALFKNRLKIVFAGRMELSPLIKDIPEKEQKRAADVVRVGEVGLKFRGVETAVFPTAIPTYSIKIMTTSPPLGRQFKGRQFI